MKGASSWLVLLVVAAVALGAGDFPLYMPFHGNAQGVVAGWSLEGAGGELQAEEGQSVLHLRPGSRLAGKSYYEARAGDRLEVCVRGRGQGEVTFTVGFYGWKGWVVTQRHSITLTPEMRDHRFSLELADSAERSGDSVLFGLDNGKNGQPAAIAGIAVRRPAPSSPAQ